MCKGQCDWVHLGTSAFNLGHDNAENYDLDKRCGKVMTRLFDERNGRSDGAL